MIRVDLEAEATETIPDERLEKSIRAYLDSGAEPVTPRFAATVMLVRDSKDNQTKYRITDGNYPENFPSGQEIEVFMLRRVKTMDFVPDAVVFPGGRVDDRDANPNLPWHGPTPAEWAGYMSCTEDIARCVVVAAAREVFEECGVLLAGPDSNSLVSDLSDPSWSEDREALVHHQLSFADMLIRRGLMLRTDLLGLVSNWCTPEYEPKRYNTFFFSALMPEGQQADDKTSEAQIAGWVTPAYAMRKSDENKWLIVYPTVYNLTHIAHASNAVDFVSQRHTLHRKMKQPVIKEDGTLVLRSL